MAWIIALLSLIAGYFLILAAIIWFGCKAKIDGDRWILILIFKNAEAAAEAVMWDLFRLKSWDYQGLNFMVIDDKSEDDTWSILKKMRHKYPFLLVSASPGKRLEQIIKCQGEKVRILRINGGECPKLVRKRIISLLNHSDFDEESFFKKYS